MIDLAPERAIVVRPARPDDQAFVGRTLATQLAGVFAFEHAGGVGINREHIPREYYAKANPIADRVLDANGVRVLIAADSRMPPDRDIVGWLVYAPIPRVRAVLFVYVRKQNRRQGIARMLVDAAWPDRKGQYVHGGLRGGSTLHLLQRFNAVEMPLSDLL